MSERQIITCVWFGEDDNQYGLFFHEADMVLHSVCAEYDAGKLTSDQASEAMRPYRDFHPEIYEPDFDGEEEGGWEGLPGCDLGNEASWATAQFIDEAVALRIPGVHNLGGSPGSGPILTVESREGLESLRERLRKRYVIIVLTDDEALEWSESHERAYRVIATLREREHVAE